ncbi:MAG: type II secretion system F family protein [Candidatus Omnitrophota bacterium]
MLSVSIYILAGVSTYLVVTSFFQLKEYRLSLGTAISIADQKRSRSMPSLKIMENLRFISNLPYFKELQADIKVLNINLEIGRLILLKIVMVVLLGAAAFILFSPLYALVAAPIGFFIPDLILVKKIKAKKEAIVRMLPETIDLLELCIGAGLDFTASIVWLMDKTEANPFIEQLKVVLNEIQVGKSRTQALKDMAKRLRIPDVSSFVRTVLQAERMGTSVEEAFKNLSEDTRAMRFQAGERYAIKASLKILFPLLFCILPVILIVVAGPIIIKFTQGGLMPGSNF